jgi:hypothetical protein
VSPVSRVAGDPVPFHVALQRATEALAQACGQGYTDMQLRPLRDSLEPEA